MDHLRYLCLLLFVLSRLFIAALWSSAGKGLTSWLLFVMFNCVFVTFPCGILGQVWYLIVSIPDLYRLSYFERIHRPSLVCVTPCGLCDCFEQGTDMKRQLICTLQHCAFPIFYAHDGQTKGE